MGSNQRGLVLALLEAHLSRGDRPIKGAYRKITERIGGDARDFAMPVLAAPLVARLFHASYDRIADDGGVRAESRLRMRGFAFKFASRRLELLGVEKSIGAAVEKYFQQPENQ